MQHVLLPYRFTLFSNSVKISAFEIEVLLPYRFTLFSNTGDDIVEIATVLLPYRFTLFSNKKVELSMTKLFYYLIDLHYSQTSNWK